MTTKKKVYSVQVLYSGGYEFNRDKIERIARRETTGSGTNFDYGENDCEFLGIGKAHAARLAKRLRNLNCVNSARIEKRDEDFF